MKINEIQNTERKLLSLQICSVKKKTERKKSPNV